MVFELPNVQSGDLIATTGCQLFLLIDSYKKTVFITFFVKIRLGQCSIQAATLLCFHPNTVDSFHEVLSFLVCFLFLIIRNHFITSILHQICLLHLKKSRRLNVVMLTQAVLLKIILYQVK